MAPINTPSTLNEKYESDFYLKFNEELVNEKFPRSEVVAKTSKYGRDAPGRILSAKIFLNKRIRAARAEAEFRAGLFIHGNVGVYVFNLRETTSSINPSSSSSSSAATNPWKRTHAQSQLMSRSWLARLLFGKDTTGISPLRIKKDMTIGEMRRADFNSIKELAGKVYTSHKHFGTEERRLYDAFEIWRGEKDGGEFCLVLMPDIGTRFWKAL